MRKALSLCAMGSLIVGIALHLFRLEADAEAAAVVAFVLLFLTLLLWNVGKPSRTADQPPVTRDTSAPGSKR